MLFPARILQYRFVLFGHMLFTIPEALTKRGVNTAMQNICKTFRINSVFATLHNLTHIFLSDLRIVFSAVLC